MKRRGFTVLLCVLLFPLFSSHGAASERILDFRSDITVHRDASMTVREEIRVRSEGREIRHGIYRDFPVRYRDRLGNRYTVEFNLTGVQREGGPEPYHIEDLSNGKRIYLGHKDVLVPPGEYTYTISYRTNRQIGFFTDHDELYWNVTGNGWNFPIDHASASVRLPDAVPDGGVTQEGYTGPQGSREQNYAASVDPSGSLLFSTTQPLNVHEGLTIVVAWPKGLVSEPDTGTKLRYFASDNRSVIIGFLGLGLLLLYYLVVWVRAGRDPKPGTQVIRYSPPENMSPAVTRYIREMGYDDRIFASALISMAVKGYLRIEEAEGKYTVMKSEGGSSPLSPEEEMIMKKIFGSSGKMTFTQSNYRIIGAAVQALRDHLRIKYEKIFFLTNISYFLAGLALTVVMLSLSGIWEALEKGRLPAFFFICVWLTVWSIGVVAILSQVLRRWRSVVRNRQGKIVNAGGAVSLSLFAAPFVVGEFIGLFILAYATSLSMIFFLLCAVALNYLFSYLLKAPTRAGRRVLDAVEGFREFLRASERERLNMMNPPGKTPELFEKYLAYALALGVEQEWSEQFSDVLAGSATGEGGNVHTLSWYSGAGRSLAEGGQFASSLAGSLSESISSSSVAPGSSSGSGGGGSSGGGGGGGGGGGW